MMPPEELKRLRELCVLIPDCISADWQNTNHYEIHSMLPREYFWLSVADVFGDPNRNICECEDGKRLGAVLDFVCGVRPSLPALLDEVEQYHKLLDACRVVRERVGKVAIHGWSMEQFLADGSLREIVVAMLPVDSKRGDV
jgi:hypothetical protein